MFMIFPLLETGGSFRINTDFPCLKLADSKCFPKLLYSICSISVDPKDDIILPNPHITDSKYTSVNSTQQSMTSSMVTERQSVITDGREAYHMNNNGKDKESYRKAANSFSST